MDRKLIKLKDGIKNMTLEEVYEQFKRLIYKICQTWKGKYELDDLSQVAFIGLNKAYNSYSVEKDILFTTYVSTIINNELRMYHRKEKKHEGNISMNVTLNDTDNMELENVISDDINYENIAISNIECDKLKYAIAQLSEKERKIIEDINFRYKKQIELAEELNLNQSYISRIYKNALLKLRKIMEDDKMPKPKISRNQLIEEVRMHGTSKEATKAIANKYGLTPATIRSYYDTMDVRQESKDYKGKKLNESKSIKNKPKEKIPSLSILKQIFRGDIGDYEIDNNLINIKVQNNSFVIHKEHIQRFITELQELNKFLA